MVSILLSLNNLSLNYASTLNIFQSVNFYFLFLKVTVEFSDVNKTTDFSGFNTFLKNSEPIFFISKIFAEILKIESKADRLDIFFAAKE